MKFYVIAQNGTLIDLLNLKSQRDEILRRSFFSFTLSRSYLKSQRDEILQHEFVYFAAHKMLRAYIFAF